MAWDHMPPICLEHHPWKLHVVGTQAGVPCSSPVLLKSKVRQSGKISSFPDPLSFAYTPVVTIHKLAFFLLVAFLINQSLVQSWSVVYEVVLTADTTHKQTHITTSAAFFFFLTPTMSTGYFFFQSKINYIENSYSADAQSHRQTQGQVSQLY